MNEYVHRPIGSEVTSLAWHYLLIEEGKEVLGGEGPFHSGKEFLYVFGSSVIGSACCGAGEIRYLLVPGIIVTWKEHVNGEGLPVTLVEPVTGEEDRARVKKILSLKFPRYQVCF